MHPNRYLAFAFVLFFGTLGILRYLDSTNQLVIKPSAAHAAAPVETTNPKPQCYKYSVIPCGAWTAEQAGLLHGHAFRAKGGESFYTSFRIGNQIYWTKNPVRLHAGELIWTDGKRWVRARCGNELRLIPPTPPTNPQVNVADSELDGVIVSPAPDYPGAVFTSSLFIPTVQEPTDPVTPDTSNFPTGGLLPITYGGCCGSIPVRTPEGSSWAFMLTGVALMVGAILWRRKTK